MKVVPLLFVCLVIPTKLMLESRRSSVSDNCVATRGHSHVIDAPGTELSGKSLDSETIDLLTPTYWDRQKANSLRHLPGCGGCTGKVTFTQFEDQTGTPTSNREKKLGDSTAGGSQPEPAKELAVEAPTIADVAWIAGHWQGKAMGGSFEETWNPPFGGAMMGMFKFVEKDEIQFYEILTIVQTNNSLLLRLKHFDKSLVGWEEKDEAVEFPLVEITENEVQFDGLKFQKVDDSRMRILVNTKNGDNVQELEFNCLRVLPKKEPLPQ